jgi:hypothetical protein
VTAIIRTTLMLAALSVAAGCGGRGSGLFGGARPSATVAPARVAGAESVAVNRYLWYAALDVLSFLPLEEADPFTGVLVFGFGSPPGGGGVYRATVYVSDPALDARALNVAVATQGGPVSEDTNRAIEDAILSRARQLRVADGAL